MVSSKNVKVSQKHCLRTSIQNFTGSSPSEQIIKYVSKICGLNFEMVAITPDFSLSDIVLKL